MDDPLVYALRRGDASAFDAVYDAYHGRLYGFLVRLSGREDVADDLFQETWMRLASHAASLDPGTVLGAWLFTVARNLHVSHVRARSVDEARVRGLRLVRRESSPSPAEALETSDAERYLEAALGRLPVEHREVLLLATQTGLSHLEIAGVLRVTPAAARQRLSRARARLVEELQTTECPRHAPQRRDRDDRGP